jgi:uncharacterized protein YukJ
LSNLYADSVSDGDKDADATYLKYLDVAGHCTHYDQGKASTDYADSVKDADKDAEDTCLSYLDVAGHCTHYDQGKASTDYAEDNGFASFFLNDSSPIQASVLDSR